MVVGETRGRQGKSKKIKKGENEKFLGDDVASSGQQMLAGEVQEMLEDSLQGFGKVQESRKEWMKGR